MSGSPPMPQRRGRSHDVSPRSSLVARFFRRIPVWLWLLAIVVASADFRLLLAGGVAAPFIMVDEVIWAELGRGFADKGEPLVRGVAGPGYSVVYPLVISPAYALFDNLPRAYAAVKLINSVVMSLAAVPAYFLARRVVGQGLALLALVLQLVTGRSTQDLLGAYAPVGSASYGLGNALHYLAWHVEELALYVLVVPFAAAIVLLARARSLAPPLQAFLAALVSFTVCFVPIVAVFASRFSDRIEIGR